MKMEDEDGRWKMGVEMEGMVRFFGEGLRIVLRDVWVVRIQDSLGEGSDC
ncbi:MAG: hypothetical protein AAGB46_05415 [Verrucomicrobiota bacterium]